MMPRTSRMSIRHSQRPSVFSRLRGWSGYGSQNTHRDLHNVPANRRSCTHTHKNNPLSLNTHTKRVYRQNYCSIISVRCFVQMALQRRDRVQQPCNTIHITLRTKPTHPTTQPTHTKKRRRHRGQHKNGYMLSYTRSSCVLGRARLRFRPRDDLAPTCTNPFVFRTVVPCCGKVLMVDLYVSTQCGQRTRVSVAEHILSI